MTTTDPRTLLALELPDTDANNIFRRAVCIQVSMGRLGLKRKISSGDIDVRGETADNTTDKRRIKAQKLIIDAPEFKAIEKLDGKVTRFIESRCLPSPLKRGVHLLPIQMVEEVDAKIEELFSERAVLVAIAKNAYPARIEESKAKLGPLFDPTDFPPVDELDEEYTASTQYLSFGVPGALAAISKKIFERETEKANARIQVTVEKIEETLRATLVDLADAMVERLTPGPDGKAKKFKDSLVMNVREFISTFKAGRNLTDNQDLEKIVEQCNDVLNGVNPQLLRDNGNVRQYVAAAMAEVKKGLDKMVSTKTRLVRDEEPVAA